LESQTSPIFAEKYAASLLPAKMLPKNMARSDRQKSKFCSAAATNESKLFAQKSLAFSHRDSLYEPAWRGMQPPTFFIM
jgi:hypothetical protein